MDVCDPELQRVFKGHSDAVTSVAFCGSAMKQAVSGSTDGSVMAWNFNQRMRAFRFLGHQGAVCSVAYDGTNNLIASGSKDCTVRLWKPTAAGRCTVLKAHTAAVRCCAFSSDGSLLATSSDDKSVKLWSSKQKFLFSLNGHTNWVRACALSPDARLLVSGGDDHSVRVWDLESRAPLHSFGEQGGVHVARFHPNGSCIASAGTDGSIKLWDLRAGRIIQYYEAHTGAVTAAAFHPAGNFLLSSSLDGTLKVWDLQEGSLFYTLHGHEGPALAAEWSPSGQHFISGGADASVLVWQSNFDACMEPAVAAVAVPAPPGRAASTPVPAAHGTARAKAMQQGAGSLQHKHPVVGKVAGGGIPAAQAMQQRPVAAGHVALDSAALDCGELPTGLVGVLQQVVAQVDMLTQTVCMLEERLTLQEDRSKQAAAAQRQGQQQCMQASSMEAIVPALQEAPSTAQPSSGSQRQAGVPG